MPAVLPVSHIDKTTQVPFFERCLQDVQTNTGQDEQPGVRINEEGSDIAVRRDSHLHTDWFRGINM